MDILSKQGEKVVPESINRLHEIAREVEEKKQSALGTSVEAAMAAGLGGDAPVSSSGGVSAAHSMLPLLLRRSFFVIFSVLFMLFSLFSPFLSHIISNFCF